MLRIEKLSKTFTMHLRGGIRLPVLAGLDLVLDPGECVALHGPSGAGKSTLLRSVYGNYRPQQGRILIRHDEAWLDIGAATPQQVIELRRRTVGYVSQFLRVIPRVSTLDIVCEPMLARGLPEAEARRRAGAMLSRLRIGAALWTLPPATFSGGEQQRVNIARVFAAGYPLLLLDEPTASLDDANRQTVVDLIREARQSGSAVLAIMHDPAAREAVTTRTVTLQPLGAAA